jgi:hypothetical protein
MKTILIFALTLFTSISFAQAPTVGSSIQADFDGDGIKEFAFAVQTKTGKGNPIDGGSAGEFAIGFSDAKFKSINVGCCNFTLINEGDLNNDGKPDITIFQSPMNGNIYSLTTYSYFNGAWKIILNEMFSYPEHHDLSDDDLQKLIVKEGGIVYMLNVDPNDEDMKLVKMKVKLK